VLFLSYHYLVRPTFIGQLLNGRKIPRKAAPPPSPRRPSPPPADHGRADRLPSCAASPSASAR
jgi:hypothetical protein